MKLKTPDGKCIDGGIIVLHGREVFIPEGTEEYRRLFTFKPKPRKRPKWERYWK